MQFFIGSTSLDVIDLYPDDLPNEWRFDYYYNAFEALRLDCDTDEDLDEILENIDDEFQLVIDITNTFNLALLLEKTSAYKDNIVITCSTSEHIKALKGYRYCVNTSEEIKGAHSLELLDNTLNYTTTPVFCIPKPEHEMHMREIIEELLPLNTNVIILIDNADRETLEKMRIIADILS